MAQCSEVDSTKTNEMSNMNQENQRGLGGGQLGSSLADLRVGRKSLRASCRVPDVCYITCQMVLGLFVCLLFVFRCPGGEYSPGECAAKVKGFAGGGHPGGRGTHHTLTGTRALYGESSTGNL